MKKVKKNYFTKKVSTVSTLPFCSPLRPPLKPPRWTPCPEKRLESGILTFAKVSTYSFKAWGKEKGGINPPRSTY